jgi:hypothetical protein
MPTSNYYGGAPEQRCANFTCRQTFPPNHYGRHKLYCSHRCVAAVWARRARRGISSAAIKTWQEQRAAERQAWIEKQLREIRGEQEQ